ncbi:hypothetical protein [Schaalia canis]|uniref:Uncharacterized protein n=1 Tax=Schaalia canis TaxID=100469 RepID=A0A3P1SF14_9ACTO|nr:hypothetical protein [Schaalia canis]RRC95873.1 hypothetical protein EII11_03175 [Schaalia canis]
MRIHYFQRYHQKENVATANTMLLLSRLYAHSPDKFFLFLSTAYFGETFNLEPAFALQERGDESIPDATITQEGFKIVVETKTSDWFYPEQLEAHLKSFGDQKNKILLTLAPEEMDQGKCLEFQTFLDEHNQNQQQPIRHINTTFEQLAQGIENILDERDEDIHDILADYRDYCLHDGLISVNDSWKWMVARLAGKTFDFNLTHRVYYNLASRGFRPHDYLGLYRNKSVRAIGKISARIVAVRGTNGMEYTVEHGELTDDHKQCIDAAMVDARQHGWDLGQVEHRYFFVDDFHPTDFNKITPYAPRSHRTFDLTEILGTDTLPNEVALAKSLTELTWE